MHGQGRHQEKSWRRERIKVGRNRGEWTRVLSSRSLTRHQSNQHEVAFLSCCLFGDPNCFGEHIFLANLGQEISKYTDARLGVSGHRETRLCERCSQHWIRYS